MATTTSNAQPLNVEALAVALAWEDVHDHTYGNSWFGWPNPEDDDQMRESMLMSLPRCREQAQRYADLLTSPVEGKAESTDGEPTGSGVGSEPGDG